MQGLGVWKGNMAGQREVVGLQGRPQFALGRHRGSGCTRYGIGGVVGGEVGEGISSSSSGGGEYFMVGHWMLLLGRFRGWRERLLCLLLEGWREEGDD